MELCIICKNAVLSHSYTCDECYKKMNITKRCKICDTIKPVDDFYSKKSVCKQCFKTKNCIKCKKRKIVTSFVDDKNICKMCSKICSRNNIINHFLATVVTNKMYKSCKKQHCYKKYSSTKLLGGSLASLIEWLSFQKGEKLNFLDYGKTWKITYCLPAKLFNLNDRQEQLKCFHRSNYTIHELH